MRLKILSDITDIETIAVGSSIREITRLGKRYGKGRWRKMKASPLSNWRMGVYANWYEAPGIGKKSSSASDI